MYRKKCPHHGMTDFLLKGKRCRACNNRWVAQSNEHMEEREIYRGEPCFICSMPMDPPCFDETDGVFRGWLCDHCNRGLGHFRHNPDFLEFASMYLQGKWAQLERMEANRGRDVRKMLDQDVIDSGEQPVVWTRERARDAAKDWKYMMKEAEVDRGGSQNTGWPRASSV